MFPNRNASLRAAAAGVLSLALLSTAPAATTCITNRATNR